MEFKPALVYNFKTGKAGIGIKNIILKPFVHSEFKWRLIVFGVTDEGVPQGLSFDYSLSGIQRTKRLYPSGIRPND